MTYLDAYRSRLGAMIQDLIDIDSPRERVLKILSMSTEEMLELCKSNPDLWRMWNNKMQGQVYPPGDPRNPKN